MSVIHYLTAATGLVAASALSFFNQPSTGPAESAAAAQPAQQQAAPAVDFTIVRGGPAVGKRDASLEVVATFDKAMPTTITISPQGRIFLAFPRWNDPIEATLTELIDGKAVPFPDKEINAFDVNDPKRHDPRTHLVNVQGMCVDARNRLWVPDTGSVNLGPTIENAPKLWVFDLNSGQRVKEITFPSDVVLKKSYLNDIRVDASLRDGVAYITDSGVGGIIVVDFASGNSWRRLHRHESTLPELDLPLQTEGEPFRQRLSNGEMKVPPIASDGIALSPDCKTLYYTPLISRSVYAVDAQTLADPDQTDDDVAKSVTKLSSKPSANDGITTDAAGRIYTTDWEDNCIRVIDPGSGTASVLLQDDRVLWPDSVWVHDNHAYFTSNQLPRQPNYHFGKDMRKPPYAVFRKPLSGPLSDSR